LVCPRLQIKCDDPSTHGQTPPVKIKIKELPGLIDIMSSRQHHGSSSCVSRFLNGFMTDVKAFVKKFP
jgi:hypothetical protein